MKAEQRGGPHAQQFVFFGPGPSPPGRERKLGYSQWFQAELDDYVEGRHELNE